MGIAQYDPAALGRPAWNAGRKVGIKKPLKQRQIWAIRFFLDREARSIQRSVRWEHRPAAASAVGSGAPLRYGASGTGRRGAWR